MKKIGQALNKELIKRVLNLNFIYLEGSEKKNQILIVISFKFFFSDFVTVSLFLASYFFDFLNFFTNAAKTKIVAINPITPTIIKIKTKRDIPFD